MVMSLVCLACGILFFIIYLIIYWLVNKLVFFIDLKKSKKFFDKKYSDIMHIHDELKKYSYVCNSKNVCNVCCDKTNCEDCLLKNVNDNAYLNWKGYIEMKLSKISSPEHLINFKHFIKNRMRDNNHFSGIFSSILSIFITLYINQYLAKALDSEDVTTRLLIIILSILCFAHSIINDNSSRGKENDFYDDLIKIINNYLKHKYGIEEI